MQGSYKNNGLPRPYYMKPMKGKKGSPYETMSHDFFRTPRRKLVGYLVMLTLFCTSVYWLGQSLRASPEFEFELEEKQELLSANDILEPNMGADLDVEKDESGNIGLAGNMAMGSKGDVGRGVQEAPKGGIANEAPVVGNDEVQILKGNSITPNNAIRPEDALI